MKFPYGICDFQKIISQGYFYADRTDLIPLLEETGDQLLFLRPRRFGKSLLLSMLENYYDLAKADSFTQLFGHLKIGKKPTQRHHSYFILKWDFSAVSPQGTAKEIRQNLHDYLNIRIEYFAAYYRDWLAAEIHIKPGNALFSFQSLLNAVQQSGHPFYLLIDEYDNFANEVMANAEQRQGTDYITLLSGEGALKALFKVVKSAAAGQGLDRVFITGVSPVVLSDITSGYNVAENIYLLPEFNHLCGFHQEEIAEMLQQIVAHCDLPEAKTAEALALMRTFYNGYCFSPRTEKRVYNPTLALYFLKSFQRDCEYPEEIQDSNLVMDRGKIRYISRLPGGDEVLAGALAEDPPLSVPKLARRFGVQDMLAAKKDDVFMASLLYYFGVLTIGGKGEFGKIILTIPNLVIRKLYAERIRDGLLPDNRSIEAARQAAEALCQQGNIRPLCDFVEQRYFRIFHNRDYAWSNELTVKTAFLTLLFNDTFYIMESETALERSYADLTMIVRPDMRQYGLLDILLEFKYVSLKEAGLNGEQLEQLSQEELRLLPAVQKKQEEARQGLARYQEKLRHKFAERLRLRSFSVVSVGFERLVFSKECTEVL
ncbi:MAG: AAA family ATPase [Candidatus Electrothrix sp. GW3-4]|uniref:AAA family ATPase n=1 Tax=Candidatus Electrothrix sp. GW3-4 TaxID=3126740 RepID=UPI0030CE8AE1